MLFLVPFSIVKSLVKFGSESEHSSFGIGRWGDYLILFTRACILQSRVRAKATELVLGCGLEQGSRLLKLIC